MVPHLDIIVNGLVPNDLLELLHRLGRHRQAPHAVGPPHRPRRGPRLRAGGRWLAMEASDFYSMRRCRQGRSTRGPARCCSAMYAAQPGAKRNLSGGAGRQGSEGCRSTNGGSQVPRQCCGNHAAARARTAPRRDGDASGDESERQREGHKQVSLGTPLTREPPRGGLKAGYRCGQNHASPAAGCGGRRGAHDIGCDRR